MGHFFSAFRAEEAVARHKGTAVWAGDLLLLECLSDCGLLCCLFALGFTAGQYAVIDKAPEYNGRASGFCSSQSKQEDRHDDPGSNSLKNRDLACFLGFVVRFADSVAVNDNGHGVDHDGQKKAEQDVDEVQR